MFASQIVADHLSENNYFLDAGLVKICVDMNKMTSVIVLHLGSAFFMTGAIWVIQVLHYPSFEFFSKNEFSSKMRWHQNRVSWIVVPAMLVELVTGGWICWKLGFHDLVWNVNLGMLILTWLSTAVLQGPAHQYLLKGHNLEKILFLKRSNWIRVVFWTVRSWILLYFLAY